MKKHQNPDWLYNQYWVEMKSSVEMAEETGVTPRHIRYCMEQNNIERRKDYRKLAGRKGKIHYDKQWLINKYWDKGLTLDEIADLAGTSSSRLIQVMDEFGIDRRPSYKEDKTPLSDETVEFIEGEMLGDGHLARPDNHGGYYSIKSKFYNYLRWVDAQIPELKQSGRIHTCETEWATVYGYHTRRNIELGKLQQRWYPNGIKIIPRDLELTPIKVRQWYIGDGSYKQRPAKPQIRLYTNAFTKEECQFLSDLFADIGLSSSVTRQRPGQYAILLLAESNEDFFDYIGDCPKELYSMFGYKWGYFPYSEAQDKLINAEEMI